MMYLRGLVFSTLFLPGVARRAHSGVSFRNTQQRSDARTEFLDVSAEAQDYLPTASLQRASKIPRVAHRHNVATNKAVKLPVDKFIKRLNQRVEMLSVAGEHELSDESKLMLEDLKSKTLLEASELVKTIEETFVDDASAVAGAPINVAAPGAAAGVAAAAETVEEKTDFTVILESFPVAKKIAVLLAVRAAAGVGLEDAMELVEAAPKEIKKGLPKAAAEDLKRQIEEAGGVVALKSEAPVAAELGEDKAKFTVMLVSFPPDKKIAVLQVVSAAAGVGKQDGMKLVEAAPIEIRKGLPKADAEDLKEQIEEAGGVVALKSEAPVGAEPGEEKTEFTVMLESFPPDKKIDVLRVVSAAAGVGMQDAMELVEAAPKEIKKGLPKADAEDLKEQIEEAGGVVALK